MAVNNKAFERFFVSKKLLADPEQIVFCLLVHGNTGPNAGMDKPEITAVVEQVELL
jgi:hypothetical protein